MTGAAGEGIHRLHVNPACQVARDSTHRGPGHRRDIASKKHNRFRADPPCPAMHRLLMFGRTSMRQAVSGHRIAYRRSRADE
jgi:hypothetical protein